MPNNPEKLDPPQEPDSLPSASHEEMFALLKDQAFCKREIARSREVMASPEAAPEEKATASANVSEMLIRLGEVEEVIEYLGVDKNKLN